MQDPSSLYASQINNPEIFPEQEVLKCPRCDSINTKFCYYNNYNLSQPRHFCKSCKRYWTKGGILRKIPIGGSSRKNTKRSSSSSSSNSKRSSTTSFSSSASAELPKTDHFAVPVVVPASDQKIPILDANGPFSSLNGPEIENLVEGLSPNGSYSGLVSGSVDASQIGNGGSSSNGWPDLAIYTPGSGFQ